MTKLNAASRTEVIAIAIKYGLIKVVPGSTKAYAEASAYTRKDFGFYLTQPGANARNHSL